jgi:PAS domain S-box-containing protein
VSTVPPEGREGGGSAFEESAEELYEMAPCGYLSTTPDGRIIRVNGTFVRWIGYTREELIPAMRFIDLLTPGGRLFYETHFRLMLRMHGSVNEIALDLTSRSGAVIPALVNATEKRDEAGQPVANRVTVFNASDRRQYERELLMARRRADQAAAELARSNAALLKANEELGQFAYAASHDLQEPLRTVTSYVQLLQRRYAQTLEAPASDLLSEIVQGTRRMQELVRDLLAYSQAQGSHLVLRPADSKQVLQNVLANLRSAVDESGAVIEYEELPVLHVDAGRLAQVFQNLIGNAIKYRRSVDVPYIRISAREGEGEWVFSVVDNGMGFTSADAAKIFGVFKRLHGPNIPGTGIGLAICKKIVEAHEGRIWAESTPGVGSTFSFSIPTRLTARSTGT